MKKVITFLTSVCLFCSLAVSTKVVKANSNDYFKGQTLTIYNVEDYISQGEEGYVDIIGNFEKEYGVKLIIILMILMKQCIISLLFKKKEPMI